MSEIFRAIVPDGATHPYGPTIALGEHLFKAPSVDAITYPCVATDYLGLNIAMLPATADAVFCPSEAWVIETASWRFGPLADVLAVVFA